MYSLIWSRENITPRYLLDGRIEPKSNELKSKMVIENFNDSCFTLSVAGANFSGTPDRSKMAANREWIQYGSAVPFELKKDFKYGQN